jgi:hypothetical protein
MEARYGGRPPVAARESQVNSVVAPSEPVLDATFIEVLQLALPTPRDQTPDHPVPVDSLTVGQDLDRYLAYQAPWCSFGIP